uniref:hypothetical protein n=6 Tax=Enterobacteriaceae TaxID=543 RepID=UPI00197AFC6C
RLPSVPDLSYGLSLLLSCGLKKEIIDYVRNSTRISRIFRIKSGENITSALKLNSHNRLPGIYNPKDIVSILIGSYQSQSL